MERVLERGDLKGILVQALVLAALAFVTVVVAFGMESVAPGVHDAFHDFRHVLGMPCH